MRRRSSTSQREACRVLKTCSTGTGTERSPVATLISTGKNVMIAVTTTFGVIPKPKATTRAGVMATTGVTFRTTANGITARRTTGISDISRARRKAEPAPTPTPTRAMPRVDQALVRKSVGSPVRAAPTSPSRGNR